MQRSTVISFVATLGLAVPAAWHVLGADILTDGKKLRPMQQSFTFDDTRVTLDVDRSLVITGDKVHATLRAYGPPRQIAVDLSVLQSNNYEGERVEEPSDEIDHEKLVLTVLPDGGPEVALPLSLGKRVKRKAMTDSFKVFVTQHGHRPAADRNFEGMPTANQPDWEGDVEAGNAAAVSILGWSGNNMSLAVVPRGPITTHAPFIVDLKIKNTSGRVLPHAPTTSLSTQIGVGGYVESGEDIAIEEIDETGAPLTYGDDTETPIAVNEEITAHYRVTPDPKSTRREITFVASVDAWEDRPGPTIAGAMDAKTFAVEEPTPSVASK